MGLSALGSAQTREDNGIMLTAARTAAWQDEDVHLGQRWWRAFKAAHQHASNTLWGPIALPHTIQLERITVC